MVGAGEVLPGHQGQVPVGDACGEGERASEVAL